MQGRQRRDLDAVITRHARQSRAGTPRYKKQIFAVRAAVVRQRDKHLTAHHQQLFDHIVFLRRKAVERVERDGIALKQFTVGQQLADLCKRIQRIHITALHDRVVRVIHERGVVQLSAQGVIPRGLSRVTQRIGRQGAFFIFLDGGEHQLAHIGGVGSLIENRQLIPHLLERKAHHQVANAVIRKGRESVACLLKDIVAQA